MKKLILLLAAVLMTVGANAQFEKGKYWMGASVTGVDLSFSPSTKLSLGLDASAGYFYKDNILLKGNVGIDAHSGNSRANEVKLGIGGRYYMVENGIFFGADLNYVHSNVNYNDLVPQLEVGYAFFINRILTIEPAVYYRQAFSDTDFSRLGVKIGIGINLDKLPELF